MDNTSSSELKGLISEIRQARKQADLNTIQHLTINCKKLMSKSPPISQINLLNAESERRLLLELTQEYHGLIQTVLANLKQQTRQAALILS